MNLTDAMCLQAYANMARHPNFWPWNTHLGREKFLLVKNLFLRGVRGPMGPPSLGPLISYGKSPTGPFFVP